MSVLPVGKCNTNQFCNNFFEKNLILPRGVFVWSVGMGQYYTYGYMFICRYSTCPIPTDLTIGKILSTCNSSTKLPAGGSVGKNS